MRNKSLQNKKYKKLKWKYSIIAEIHSPDGEGHCLNKLDSKMKLKNNLSDIYLENMAENKISVIIKFQTGKNFMTNDDHIMRNNVEQYAEKLFNKFKYSLKLKNYNLDNVESKNLKCLNCKGKMSRTTAYFASACSILGVTRLISDIKLKQINELYNESEFEQLIKIADGDVCLTQNEQFQHSFIDCWIKFNSVYNPARYLYGDKSLLNSYVESLNKVEINVLLKRNKILIDLLSRSDIKNHNDNFSEKLKSMLHKKNKKNIIKATMMCIYQCRNELIHNGVTNFKDFKKLSKFLFDILYLNQLIKYDKNGIVTYFER